MIADAIKTPILIILVVLLIFNLTQRRHLKHGEKKRIASLGLAGVLLFIYASLVTIERFSLSDGLVLIPFAAAVVFLYRFRQKLFIFSFHCVQCRKPLPLIKTLYYDAGICESCVAGSIPPSGNGPRTVEEIDWGKWTPDEDAVLCFIRKDSNILLINKKTGLGAGKVNAPGGRIEDGESPLEAAVRETKEEISVTPENPKKHADLSFSFTNGYSLHASVFFADVFSGEPTESDEAKPFWCPIEQIPFERMWEDDSVWLPPAIEGKLILGKFIFDGDTMLSKEITEVESFGT